MTLRGAVLGVAPTLTGISGRARCRNESVSAMLSGWYLKTNSFDGRCLLYLSQTLVVFDTHRCWSVILIVQGQIVRPKFFRRLKKVDVQTSSTLPRVCECPSNYFNEICGALP